MLGWLALIGWLNESLTGLGRSMNSHLAGGVWPFFMMLALVGLAALYAAGRFARTTARAPYQRGRFLTVNEKCFLRALDGALGDGYRVFAQARLAELVDVESRFSDERRHAALRKVFGKSVDFVICKAVTFEPVAVIEVDDRTHLYSTRRERDIFVNSVFDEIGLPLLRVTAKRDYTVPGLRKMLASAGVGAGLPEAAVAGRGRS